MDGNRKLMFAVQVECEEPEQIDDFTGPVWERNNADRTVVGKSDIAYQRTRELFARLEAIDHGRFGDYPGRKVAALISLYNVQKEGAAKVLSIYIGIVKRANESALCPR